MESNITRHPECLGTYAAPGPNPLCIFDSMPEMGEIVPEAEQIAALSENGWFVVVDAGWHNKGMPNLEKYYVTIQPFSNNGDPEASVPTFEFIQRGNPPEYVIENVEKVSIARIVAVPLTVNRLASAALEKTPT